MSTAVNTMTNFMSVMQDYANDANASGTTLLNDAVRSVSRFSSLQDAINNFVSDTTSTATYSNVNTRLKNVCGIVLGAENDFTTDTGAVTGKNAGGSTTKNAVSIVPETSSLTNLSLPTAGSTTTHTYTGADGKTFTFSVKWPASFTKFYDCSTINSSDDWTNLTTSQFEALYTDISATSSYTYDNGKESVTGSQLLSGMNTIIKGLYNFWLPQGFKLAYDSFGLDFNGKTIEIQFAGCGNFVSSVQAMTGPEENPTTPTDKISMMINLPLYSVIDSANQNGNTRVDGGANQCYLDRTIAHELIHAVMYGKGIIKGSTPEFFSEGVAELVHGLDDYDGQNTADILALASSYDSLSAAMPLTEGTGTNERYTAGYMFLRYLCKQSLNTSVQFGNSTSPITFEYSGGTAVVNDYKSSDKINYSANFTGVAVNDTDLILNSSSGNLYIRNSRNKLVNVSDANGNISAYGYMASGGGELNGSSFNKFEVIVGANNLSNTITAGSGGAWMWGGTSSADTLIGGAGSDVFYYTIGSGNDTIQNAASNDTVNLLGVSVSQITSAQITDNGVIANFSDGGSLNISGQAGNFILGGQTYHADYQNKVWTV